MSNHENDNSGGGGHHHIIPTKTALKVGGILLFLTFITVWVAGIDLGPLNFTVAMVVATIKALLVCLFFMNLLYDSKENGLIFASSFLFLAIFIVLTATDIFFRGDVYVKGPLMAEAASKVSKPWVVTPELVKKGKEVFAQQCTSCHGAEGKGDGAAAAALNPKPRDFTNGDGWKNGRKPSQVFKTLKDGIPGGAMGSFATVPADDRWALSHYVLTLGPDAPKDSNDDLAKIGVDPNKAGGGEVQAASIPVDFAIERMAKEAK